MNWSNVDTRWMEDDENENKEEKADQLGAMMKKKLDKLFFERRMV